MKKKVLIYKKGMSEDLILKLQENYSVKIYESLNLESPEIVEDLKDSVGLIGWGGSIGEELTDKAPQLKVVSTISVGYDHVDVPLLTKKGIALMHTPTVLTETVADLAFTLLLNVARRVSELDRWIRHKNWSQQIKSPHYGVNVHKKTLGVVGMGRIGAAIAQRAFHGFKMPVLYHSRSRHTEVEESTGAIKRPLEKLVEESDFICNVLPYSKETHHIFDAKIFDKMKKEAVFINIGRGQTVCEKDLIEALESSKLYGAGLDVYETEPLPNDSKLLNLENVVLTPHIGSATKETRAAMDEVAVENLVLALKGDLGPNCVNPEALS